MSTPEYYTRESLAAAAGVSLATLEGHLRINLGNVNAAREKFPGLGLRFVGSKCRKYLALNHANPKRRAKAEGAAV